MRPTSRILIGLWLVAVVGVSHARLAVWRSDIALWTAAVSTDPAILRPRINLASALMVTDHAAAGVQWQAAMTIIDREEHLPWPPSMRREVALNLAALASMQHAPMAALLLWGGCEPRDQTWACPPN